MNEIFHIPCDSETKDETLDFLKEYSNDIIINNIRENSIGITIQSDEAEQVYDDILEKIGRRRYLRK